ncbi:MAG TPA: 8-amino-7-oxononanoate synthase [Verrucomicrobiae bacterium]|nr:8-amino-7-oxononanoate synthase [Verrucomicrobiae bacterium]
MSALDQELGRRLAALRGKGLHRELRRITSPQSARVESEGKTLLNFSSNDYLGLANEPSIADAAIEAVRRFGAGAGASRLICGSLTPHHELEEALAQFKGTQAALSFSTGYAAAIGTICALLGKEDVLVLDKLVHASIVDAARLCGAKLRIFSHNDLGCLEDILKWARNRGVNATGSEKEPARILVATESVFSMEGDHAPLAQIIELKDKYGAWLMVDEAHATGLYGPKRRGLAEEYDVAERIEIQMGTLGKAMGAAGGYICGSRVLIDYLINRARSFIFSTAPAPAAAAAATAGVRFVQSEAGEHRRQILWRRVAELAAARAVGKPNVESCTDRSAIVPIIIGSESRAVEVAALSLDAGILIPAIRYPTVPRGSARLRLTLTAAHTNADIHVLAEVLRELQLIPNSFLLAQPVDASPG